MKRVLAVREIAYFLYASGDLTSDFFLKSSSEEGKKAHSYIQKNYSKEDKAEFYIKQNLTIAEDDIEIHGYIDGVIKKDDNVILEEIKSVRVKLKEIEIDSHKEHLAQLKLYAYMYANLYEMNQINVRLTYIKTDNYTKKSFDLSFSIEELKDFFYESINNYLEWLYLFDKKNEEKMFSIKGVKFPFSTKREGQNDFMKASYYTLKHCDILYAIAPTGIGKTISALFSGLKSLSSYNDKLYYLTSKGTQKQIAIDNLKLLINNGLKIKALSLTSKVKACLNENKKSCDPNKCIYAKGYFNKVKPAFLEIYENYDIFTYDVINEISLKYEVCPFELSLFLSSYSDIVICDYNYVFDPRAHLEEFYSQDSNIKPKLLIDEAHNLVSRSKDMYTKEINFKNILILYDILNKKDEGLYKYVFALEEELKKKIYNDDGIYYNVFPDELIVNILYTIKNRVEDILEGSEEFKDRDIVLESFNLLNDFESIIDYYNEAFRFFIYKELDDYKIKVMCLDASMFVYKTIKEQTYGTIFFSATLTPINYYMTLLSRGEGKYITFKSPFNQNNFDLIINNKISTTYTKREATIKSIVNLIDTIITNDKGNYIIFFPSYKYMNLFMEHIDISKYNLIIQKPEMTDVDRINILEMFNKKGNLALFVLGGIFGEGIDFAEGSINGVIVVGVGIPQYNLENEILKDYFDSRYDMGYEYAYTYPGFNKVIQAAGRLIRRDCDRGICLLIDDRYRHPSYIKLMPPHWNHYKVINDELNLGEEIKKFKKEN